jgi:hypothetical protein
MRPGLLGEKHLIAARTDRAAWPAGEVRPTDSSRPLQWHRTEVRVPENLIGHTAVFRLDASGLGKGIMWVNGRTVGRHWLILASRPVDTPSQRYYHVPADWLQPVNEIVILEEHAASPTNVQLQYRV